MKAAIQPNVGQNMRQNNQISSLKAAATRKAENSQSAYWNPTTSLMVLAVM